MIISPFCLDNMTRIQKNFGVKMRPRVNKPVNKRIINWRPFWNKVCVLWAHSFLILIKGCVFYLFLMR